MAAQALLPAPDTEEGFEAAVGLLTEVLAAHRCRTVTDRLVVTCETADRLRFAGWEEREIAEALLDAFSNDGCESTVRSLVRLRNQLQDGDRIGFRYKDRLVRLWGIDPEEVETGSSPASRLAAELRQRALTSPKRLPPRLARFDRMRKTAEAAAEVVERLPRGERQKERSGQRSQAARGGTSTLNSTVRTEVGARMPAKPPAADMSLLEGE